MKEPCVYILASTCRGTLYTGVTSDLIQRVWEHRSGVTGGFTAKYHVHRLVWFEETEDMHQAIAREKAIKKWRRAWKLELVESANPGWLDLYPRLLGGEDQDGSPLSRG